MAARKAHNLEATGSNPVPAIDPCGRRRHSNDMHGSRECEIRQVPEVFTAFWFSNQRQRIDVKTRIASYNARIEMWSQLV